MPVTSKSVVDDKEPSSSKGVKAPYMGGATANCTIRCSVEKRSYCRELQKWSKNLLYMVGLENVAKKLTDRKSWIKISPFIESDPSRLKCEERKPIADCLDWNPEEHCPICKGKGKEQKPSKSVENHKHHQPLETKQQTKETVANSISSPPIDFFDMQSSLQRNSLENLITYPAVPYFDLSQAYLSQLMLHWSKLAPFSLHPPIGPLMLPFAPPNLLQTSASSSATLCDPSAIYQNGATASTLSNSADEPLDLSVKTRSNTNAHHNSTKSNKIAPPQNVTQNQQQQQAQPPFTLSAQPNVTNGATSKKAYSQADLEAAVQDIRCGKLGTRRASVVYGIPRSTLRNKIYKLEASEEGGAGGSGRSKRKKTAVATTTTVVNSVAKIIDANAKACVKASTPAAATASVVVRTSPIGSLLTSSEESSETNGSAIQTYCQSAAAEKLVHELAKYKAASISQCCWALTNGSPIDDLDSTAISTTIGKNETCRSVLVKSLVDDAAHSALHDQLLKTRNNHVASIVDGCSGGGDSGAAAVVGRSGRNNKRSTNSSRRGGGKSCENILHAVKRPRSANSNGNLSSDCSQSALLANGSTDAQRKVRPKRGQYRRYDKNALAEAVQSVRRGEMSVHRAGSYYGVPHSTLEYKVKERNLLRPKKRDQTRQNRAAAAAAAVAATAAESSTTTAASGKSSARRNSVAARRDSASAGSAVDSPLNNCIAADTVTPIADECDEISSPVKKRCRDDDDNDEDDDDDEENSTERRLVIENDEDAPMIDGEASNGLEQRQLPAVVPI